MSMDPFNCRDFVKEIKQQVDDEQFIVNIHKYIETYRQYIPISRNDIALVIQNSSITPTKYGYEATIIDIFDEDKDECVFTADYIDWFDDHKVIYNQIYLSESTVAQIDRNQPRSVLFIGLEQKTYKKGKEIYQAHPIKVVNKKKE